MIGVSIGVILATFTIGRMLSIGVVTMVKIWMVMSAVAWTCYLITFPFLRASWLLILSSPVYIIGICFVMYGKECAMKFRECTPFGKNKAQSKIKKLELSNSSLDRDYQEFVTPITIATSTPTVQERSRPIIRGYRIGQLIEQEMNSL